MVDSIGEDLPLGRDPPGYRDAKLRTILEAMDEVLSASAAAPLR